MALSILHLIDSLDAEAGGPVELVKALSREHAAMGHRVCAALLTWPNGPAPEGMEIVWAGQKNGYGGYGFRTGLVAWLREEARRHDVIFVHGLWQYHGAAAWLALTPQDTPYYLFPHGMLDPWCIQNRHRYWKKRGYWQAVEKHVARRARAVLFTSETEMRRAPEPFGKHWSREELVVLGAAEPPGGSDGSGAAEAQREAFLERFPKLRGKRYVLFLGRIDPKKGCELLAEAFAEVAPEDVDLVLAGPCNDAWYSAVLHGMAAKCGRIHFTGMLEGAEKWGAFRCAEVFALPSHQENFGIAVAEALACGTPALVSTGVDIHRTVTEAGAGLSDSDDLEGTRRMLGRWFALTEEERRMMRGAAVECFRRHFHIRKTAERLIELVEK
jgi:glycosyltransferase involved in cell wall biosynthesis